MAAESILDIDREKFDKSQAGKFKKTIVSSEKALKELKKVCELCGSQLTVILRPGDNVIGVKEKNIYNSDVSGRFVIIDGDFEVISDTKVRNKMPENTYFVEYQIGREGYFKFFETLEKIRSNTL